MCDSSVWRHSDFVSNVRENALLIFNSSLSAQALEKELRSGKFPSRLKIEHHQIITTDATALAIQKLGRPIVNTALMGAFAAALFSYLLRHGKGPHSRTFLVFRGRLTVS